MTVVSIDPRTGAAVEDVADETTTDEVAALCAEATEATAQLAALLPRQRADLLRAMADELDAHRERLVALADRESALGPARLNGELARTTGQLRLFAEVLEDGHAFEAVIDHGDQGRGIPDLRRMMIGIGPVAVFGASNFPFAFSAAGGDTASALAAGNAVVVKAHGSHPRLDAEVVGILRAVCADTGLSAATVSVVYGRQAGTDLVQDPRIQAVGFTGSESVGRMLMDLAAARPQPIPVFAEMGSLNPLVVSPRAAEARAAELAEGIAGSVTLGHGQFCTKPGIVLVPTGDAGDRVVSGLAAAMGGREQQYMLSPAIRRTFEDNVAAVADGLGVRMLLPVRPVGEDGSAAHVALAEVGAANLAADPSVLRECFGPACLVVRFDGTTQLLDTLRLVEPSLTVSVHAEPAETVLVTAVGDLAARRAGRLIFNGYPTGVAVSWAQTHGGPYPAASSGQYTSVGAAAITRFLRPVSFQSWPDELLPPHLQEANPLGLPRRVDGRLAPAPAPERAGSRP